MIIKAIICIILGGLILCLAALPFFAAVGEREGVCGKTPEDGEKTAGEGNNGANNEVLK